MSTLLLHRIRSLRMALARALALVAVIGMILSAYAFRPRLESLAHYRPTPGPRDYYDPLAPWYFAVGALALAGAMLLASPFPRTSPTSPPDPLSIQDGEVESDAAPEEGATVEALLAAPTSPRPTSGRRPLSFQDGEGEPVAAPEDRSTVGAELALPDPQTQDQNRARRAAPLPQFLIHLAPPLRLFGRGGWGVRLAWLLVVPGALVLWAMAEANGNLIGFKPVQHMTPLKQLALLIAGVVLIVIGLGGLPRRKSHAENPTPQAGRGRSTSGFPPSLACGEGAGGEVNLRHEGEQSAARDDPSPVGALLAAPTSPPIPGPSPTRGEGRKEGLARGRGLRRLFPLSHVLYGRGARGEGVFTSEIAFVLLITLLALGLRLWKLDSSVRVMVDEGHFALGTAYFWTFPDVKLLEPMPTSASFPFIFSYGQSGMVELFGRNFLGLRAFSALLGALTVSALYLLARELFDRRTAVIAALILLTFPPQVHYSRLALNNIADPLFGTLALGLLARGVRTRQRFDYVLGGAVLGFTQYFYEGGRLLYPALAAVWLLGGLVLWRPRPSARGMILAALAFVLVAFPVYYALIGLDFPLTDRLDKSEYDPFYWGYHREPDNLHTRIVHFRHSLMMYVNAPENTSFNYYLYYGGKYPLILPIFVPLFLLGLVIAAWRWWKPGVLPVGIVIGASLGNAMLVESAVSARYVVTFPALALLIAVGIRYTLPLFRLPRWTEGWQTGLMLALAGVIAVAQGLYYFGPFLDLFNREVRLAVSYDVDNAMLRSKHFPPGTQIFIIASHVLPEGDAQRLLNFLADDLKVYVIEPDSFATIDLASLGRATDRAYFIGADDSTSLAKLEYAYGVRVLQRSPYPVPDGKALLLFYTAAAPQ